MAAVPLISRQTGPIAVYGATGYTGRLVVAELVKARADFIVSGRSAEKLDALRAEFELEPPAKTAQLNDPSSLRDLLADCAVVIDCAGPFVHYGEPVLAAAVETGTHYLDTTGEQPYMKMAYERYGPGAARSGVAVIPAMGFDYVPGDMIASLTADGMGELDELDMHYCWRDFTPSQGTARTTLEMISGNDLEWRNMEWVEASGGVSRGAYEFPEPVRPATHVPLPVGGADHRAAPRPHPQRPRVNERRGLLQRSARTASSARPCARPDWRCGRR